MKLIFIRHGDPDYSIDSLTETGWKEAEMLAEKMQNMEVKQFYVSPLGRAQDTANVTLKKIGRTAVTMDWMKEFSPRIYKPYNNGKDSCTWDWLPSYWTEEPKYYDVNTWYDTEVMKQSGVKEEYLHVVSEFDKLLAELGYQRDGNKYKVVKANNDTYVFFCHYAITMVFLSRLLNISPMLLWHGFVCAPTSLTIAATEEREKGVAYFRVNTLSNCAHLEVKGSKAGFHARFCECYDNENERH